MKIEWVEKGYDIGNKLRDLISEKLSKLDRYFDDARAKVVCREDKKDGGKHFKMEVTITSKGFMYRTEVYGENMYENIDNALPKLERQIVKAKEMREDKRKKSSVEQAFEFLKEEPVFDKHEVIKVKTFELLPMGVEEAQVRLEALEHDFFVFMNAATGTASVIYRRKDGEYGLINTL